MKVTVSIIICTRNRAESLRATLESISKVNVPFDWAVELIVVDNGSTDHTAALVREIRMSNLQLRYLHEPKPGVSRAKNTGIRNSSGDIILCTDDDIRVPTHWIAGVCRPIVDGTADAVAGGVVFPTHIIEILKASPLSIKQSWVASTAELDPSHPARMVGANMAFHRRVLDQIPCFDVELGPGALGFSEETLFSKQLLVAGYSIIGAFDVAVEHHFDTRRLNREGILDMAKKMGRSHAFLFYHWEHRRSHLIIPRLINCFFVQLYIKCLIKTRKNQSTVFGSKLIHLEEDQAFGLEYLVQRKRRPKYSKYGFTALYPDL